MVIDRTPPGPPTRLATAVTLALGLSLLVSAPRLRVLAAQRLQPDLVTLSIVGTTDVHGSVFEKSGRGGVALLGGYVRNLRAARAADGGALLLIDSGDTFQGTVESNLTEGALVVDAYNAMGYTAEAIGNHDFDFGAVDSAPPQPTRDADQRGAIKALAARATYPFLAANLLDKTTGKPVEWPNVRPSVIVEAAGVKVGIVGVMTIDALRSTLAANVHGLALAPLAPTIAAEASKLRAAGATLVIVAAHAGGRCTQFDQPADVSSCDAGAEIFQVARNLPRGLVDVIMAGHTHQAIGHDVDGIAITQAFFGGRAFGRIDVKIDRQAKRVADVHVFAPRDLCAEVDPETDRCDSPAPGAAPTTAARYEGRAVSTDTAIVEAMAPGLQRVHDLQDVPLGVTLDTPLRRAGDLESPLGNLFADAFRESVPGADVSVSNNNAIGGLRADLPPGMLTFGGLYSVFPFDNRLVRLNLSAAALSGVFKDEIERGRRGALGISGIRVVAGCSAGALHVELRRPSGDPIGAAVRLAVVTTDFLASGAVFASVAPPEVFDPAATAPIAREVVATWLRRRGGRLEEDVFVNRARPRWEYFGTPSCAS